MNEVAGAVTAPLPVLGFWFSYQPAAGLRLFWEYNLILLKYNDYQGSYIDSALLGEYRLWRHFGIGGGFNFNVLEVKAKDSASNLRLEVESDIGAIPLYLFFKY